MNSTADEDDFEIDASALGFTYDSLHTSTTLPQVLQKYGYSKDTRLARTEQSLIYNKIKSDFLKHVNEVCEKRNYDEGRESYSKYTSIQKELKQKVLGEMQSDIEMQQWKFRKSSKDFMESIKQKHMLQMSEMNEYVNTLIENQRSTHKIQWENLEAKLSRVHCKTPKYSKTVIELLKMEKRLIQLSQFEDAKVVRTTLNRKIPVEEAIFYREFDDRLELERKKLDAAQANDCTQLEERLKTLTFEFDLRKKSELAVSQQRLEFHAKTMQHSQLLESRRDPELSTVHPSMLLHKRRGYASTSASLRGQQLEAYMRHEKGKLDPREKSMTVVYAESLVDRHDFTVALPSTIQL